MINKYIEQNINIQERLPKSNRNPNPKILVKLMNENSILLKDQKYNINLITKANTKNVAAKVFTKENRFGNNNFSISNI